MKGTKTALWTSTAYKPLNEKNRIEGSESELTSGGYPEKALNPSDYLLTEGKFCYLIFTSRVKGPKITKTTKRIEAKIRFMNLTVYSRDLLDITRVIDAITIDHGCSE